MTSTARPGTPECPDCGTDWDPNCPRATGQSWDPTRGVRSGDVRWPIRRR